MMNLILVLSLIPLGRLSGGLVGYSGWFSPLIGLVFGLLLGVTDWWLLGFMLAGWLSEKPSPAKHAIGLITDNYLHNPGRGKTWFERGILLKYPYLALSARGLISAAFFLPLIVVADTWIMLTYLISWPLAVYIGTKLPKTRFAGDAWQHSEWLRHVLVGLCIAI